MFSLPQASSITKLFVSTSQQTLKFLENLKDHFQIKHYLKQMHKVKVY